MAALIPEARTARNESLRLRGEMQTLRLAVRQRAAYSHEQRRKAEEALTRVEARREELLPSPWSALHWSYDHRALGGVLVPLP